MNRPAKEIILATVALTLCVTESVQAGPREVYREAVGATVWIVNGDDNSQGTGVIVDQQRMLAVTNYHVVGECSKVVVFFSVREGDMLATSRDFYVENLEQLDRLGMVARGKVVAKDPSVDLAVMELDELPSFATAITFSDTNPVEGEPLNMIGNPADRPLFQYATGIVERLESTSWEYDNGQHISARAVEFHSNVWSGDSGGPVMDREGKLVGIIAATSGMDAFAIHVSEVAKILATIQQYRVFSVENTTDRPVTFELRLGDGDGQSYELAAGENQTIWYSNDAKATLRFDGSLGATYDEQNYPVDYFTAQYGRGAHPNMVDDAREYYLVTSGDDLELHVR